MRLTILCLLSLYIVTTAQSSLPRLWSILESVIPLNMVTEENLRQLFITQFEHSASGLSLTYIRVLNALSEDLSLIDAVSTWLNGRIVIDESDGSVHFKEDWLEPRDIFHPTVGVMSSVYHSFYHHFHLAYAYYYRQKRSKVSASSQTMVTLSDQVVDKVFGLGRYDSFYNGWKQAVEDIVNQHLSQ